MTVTSECADAREQVCGCSRGDADERMRPSFRKCFEMTSKVFHVKQKRKRNEIEVMQGSGRKGAYTGPLT